MLWYGSRHYDPELGRFTSPDTIVPDPNNPQAWDRYSYAQNNPVRYTDPTGHRIVDGCSELAGGCNITQKIIDDDVRKANEFRQTTEANKCKGGNKLYCSYAENHPVETVIFGVGGLVVAGAGAAAVGATAVTTETVVTTGTTIEAMNTACGGDMCAGEMDELPRFFYSGGTQIEAEALAKLQNGVTITQTEAGAELNQIIDASGYNVARPFIESASANWAAEASGTVQAVLRLPLASNNVWGRIEYPALLLNKAVTTIIINIIE